MLIKCSERFDKKSPLHRHYIRAKTVLNEVCFAPPKHGKEELYEKETICRIFRRT